MPKTCQECGRKIKTFMHNYPKSDEYREIEGCPLCDDTCEFCRDGDERGTE
jgi:hypothetical protein